jgi:peptidoglycan/LPS O-acetylase OafA/YrhL
MLVYRREIDGLRAVAVVSVIMYHAGFIKFFAGGYVGVDIFFIISGYLITSVIESETSERKFSLIHFYERRCRRILPALFLILFFCSICAYYWMLPEPLKEFGQTLLSIMLLSSNFFFWYKDDGYFSQLSELNPLVHTWSLAVEEQFYLVFPIFYYIFSAKKRCLIGASSCIALISFFLSQWGGNMQYKHFHQFHMFSQHSFASFYLPIGRIWELLLGTFTAFYLRQIDSQRYLSDHDRSVSKSCSKKMAILMYT